MKVRGVDGHRPFEPGGPLVQPIIDSGASFHMTGCRDSLTNIAPCADHSVTMADERVVVGTEAGDLRVTDGSHGVLHDVVYIPTLAHTLASVSILSKNGYKCDFAGDHCTVYGPSIISGHVLEGVYVAPV
ncbi:unnamed protein product [Phytophthora lilii]|uniref:Unnamed protein product n=1 Tax=Phytophthora lilii TaxID=2077276 RepID=A0A9W6UBG4_9STRA|nr:unnamed protein product [Phytophthora lilii]